MTVLRAVEGVEARGPVAPAGTREEEAAAGGAVLSGTGCPGVRSRPCGSQLCDCGRGLGRPSRPPSANRVTVRTKGSRLSSARNGARAQ